MEIFGNNLGVKTSKNEQQNFYCKNCDYSCSRKYNWERHLITAKHQMEINGNNLGLDLLIIFVASTGNKFKLRTTNLFAVFVLFNIEFV